MEDDEDEEDVVPLRKQKTAKVRFARGDVVAVPDPDNNSFTLARVISCNDVEVTLIELKPVDVEASAYKANIRSNWQEIPSACVHVDCEYDGDTNTYRLRTPSNEVL